MRELAPNLEYFPKQKPAVRIDGNVIYIDFRGGRGKVEQIEPYPVDYLVGKVALEDLVEGAREAFLNGSAPLTAEQESLLDLTSEEVWWDDEHYA